MIGRSIIAQLIAFALITLAGVSYVTAKYVGLGDKLFGGSYVVTVDLADAGGIFTNAEVTYRGVTVGRVDALRLSEDGVLADVRLDEGTEIPADTDAVVENRSAVGEQYVDFQPASSGEPFLTGGDTIARDRTRIPVPTEVLLLDIDRLVRSVDQGDLVTVVDELGKAFFDGGKDLQRLLDSGDSLTIAATEALPETLTLINDGKIVLDTQRDTGPAIRSFATDLADLSESLVTADGDLRTVLDRGVVASREVDALLTDNRAAIAGLLTNLVTIGEVTVVRVDGLEQILVTYPDVVTGGYTVVPGDGTSHFGLVLQSDPPSCRTGYEGTQQTDPNDTEGLPPLNTGARCAEPSASGTNVRGAQNAPGSGGANASGVPTSYPLLQNGTVTTPGVGDPVPSVRTGWAPEGTSGAAALRLLLGAPS